MKLLKRITALVLCLLMLSSGTIDVFVHATENTETQAVGCTECGEAEGHLEECSNYEAPEPCKTCGKTDCSSSHENWCKYCKKDDCGKTHKVCEECKGVDGHKEDCSKAAPAPEPCKTCGKTDCSSSHENWCKYCKKDDCGKTHVVCDECEAVDGHKEGCSKAAPATEPCKTCGKTDCESDHENWCKYCEKDDCGKTHQVCEECEAVDGHKEGCSKAAPAPEPCKTCGKTDCSSSHENWCKYCEKDDCGKTHVVCDECEAVDGHKEGCSKAAPAPEPCKTCGKTDCSSSHENWCEHCKKDDCGKTHVVCDECEGVDGHKEGCSKTVDPSEATDPSETTDPSGPTEESEPEENPLLQPLLGAKTIQDIWDILMAEENNADAWALNVEELTRIRQHLDTLYSKLESPSADDTDYYDMLVETLDVIAGEPLPGGPVVLVNLTPAGGTLTAGTHVLTADLNINSGKFFTVSGNVTIDLNGYMIRAGSATNLFKIESGGHLRIIDSGDGTKSHQIVNKKTNETVTIYGGVIDGNGHRGVNISNGGKFTLEGGTIAGCQGDHGAAVWMYNGAEMEVTGGAISHNYGYTNSDGYGGGAIHAQRAKVTISGGVISNNYAYNGGAIYIESGGNLIITGGSIEYNNGAHYSGGIFSAGTIEMSGGKITHNFGNSYGGGVHLTSSTGRFTMSGGEISHNLGQSGGGVILYQGSAVFTMTGGTISDNETDGEGGTGNGGGVHIQEGTYNFYGGTIKDNVASGYGGGINIVSGARLNIGSEEYTSYISGNYAKNSDKAGGGIAVESGTITLSSENVIIDGNKAAGYGGGLAIGTNGTGTLNITAGTISNNEAATGGGGIGIKKGSATISGGTISGNETPADGGAIYVLQGNVVVSSGTVSENEAEGNGGAIAVDNGNVTIGLEACKGNGNVEDHTCPVIENNTADKNGGAISISGGKTYMYCGNLEGNSSTDNPTSNSYYQDAGTFEIWGGNLGLGVDNDNGGVYKDYREGLFNVTFVSYYDGKEHGKVTQQIRGGLVKLPGSASLHYTAFNREGKVLYGWSDEPEKLNEDYVVGKEIIIPGNATLYAVWVDASYPITYNVGDGTLAANTPESYAFSAITSSLAIPAPTSTTGSTFLGWTVSGEGNWEAGSCTTALDVTGRHGNVTLTANWGSVKYKITYDLDGGTDPGNPVGFNSGNLPITLKDPTKLGYQFTGWYDVDKNTNQGTSYKIRNQTGTNSNYRNHNLKALWERITYTATLDYNGGEYESGDTGTSISYNIEDPFTLPVLRKPGYSFAGWSVSIEDTATSNWDANTFYTGEQSGLYGNVDLIAQWKERDVTVTYAAGEGGTVSPESEVLPQETGVAQGSTAKANPGYKFIGWYDEKDTLVGSDLTFVPEKVDGLYIEATYTAKFKLDVVAVTVVVHGINDLSEEPVMVKLSGTPKDTEAYGNTISVTLAFTGSNSITIQDLPVGTYTATEIGNWTWRYAGIEASEPTVVEANTTIPVTIDGEYNPYWLNDYSFNSKEG